jgi:hypothetical protein
MDVTSDKDNNLASEEDEIEEDGVEKVKAKIGEYQPDPIQGFN